MRRGKGSLGNFGESVRRIVQRLKPVAVLGCALSFGCTANPQRSKVEKNLLNERPGLGHQRDIVAKYLVACPDVLQIHVAGRGDLDGLFTIGPNGCVTLGGYGSVRVEGMALPAVAEAVAGAVGAPAQNVHLRVAEFASRRIILIGEIVGRHRAIPYQGDETVLDVLQRVGGITPGAEPTEIYVVRSHIGDLQRPEVFQVDLQAIVLNRRHETNIRVLPYDQIFVGETRQARIEKCVPPWLRPAYQKFWNMLPTGRTAPNDESSITSWIRGLLPFGETAPEKGSERERGS